MARLKERRDLEEVRRQIGLEGNISDILDQFGASETGKISYSQFANKSSLLFGDLNHSGSESSPEYFTDSDTQLSSVPPVTMEKGRSKKEESRKDSITAKPSASNSYKVTDLDAELDASNEKLKKISNSWEARNIQRRSAGGGIEDYLDQKTLQHLEELKLINPQPLDFVMKSSAHHDEKEFSGTDCFQISEISKQVHLAALTSYENKIHLLTNRLRQVKQERDQLRSEQIHWETERQRMQKEFEEKLQSQTMRITELQSVIAELTRKLNKVNNNTIIEEEEEEGLDEEHEDDEHGQLIEDDDARSGSTSDLEVQGSHADCSDCSCENCHDFENEGPNQVNLMATQNNNDAAIGNLISSTGKAAAHEANDDIHKELSRVLGALESRTVDRKTRKDDLESLEEEKPNISPNVALQQKLVQDLALKETKFRTQMSGLLKMVEALKKEKKSLEKQVQNMNVQGYIYQKGNTAHVEDEFNKLRQENNYLRSKLKKSEQELEDTRGSLIIVREEKDKLKKKARSFQESLGGKISPVPSNGSTGSGHRRSNSAHLDHRPASPAPVPSLQRSSSSMVERPSHPIRSNSVGNRQSSPGSRSPSLHQKSNEQKYVSSNASSGTLPHSQSSPFMSINSKGYIVSPEGTLNRQHADTSDLGSSVGDEMYRNELHRGMMNHVRGRVPEALLQSLLSLHSIEQVLKLLTQHFIAEVDETVRAGEINVERLESRMAHLQSQNDLLQLSLEESKQNAERLSSLCGQYESNSTAWSLALQNTENLIETYEVLLQLQESEADIYAANCQAAGISGNFDTIKSLTSTKSSISNISIASSHNSESGHHLPDDDDLFKSSHIRRKDAETHAKCLLHKLDKKFDHAVGEGVHEIDLKSDELSYQSRTSTGSSQNSATTDTLSKDEELRLRDYVQLLKRERNICKGTVVELESVHQYTDPGEKENSLPAHVERAYGLNQDLETAVILQEMQALKEERAELKHRIYLLEKEKRSLELKINSREAQEQAYIVHIEHLKSEVKEQIRKRKLSMRETGRRNVQLEDDRSVTSSSTHSTNPDHSTNTDTYSASNDDIPGDLAEASRRERKLKLKIKELLDTLEKLTKNSDIRQRQTAEYISDLKRANGALVTAYEKAKKKHASKLKKFEQQLMQMAEKYQHQVRTLKEQIAVLKETPSNVHQTETSL